MGPTRCTRARLVVCVVFSSVCASCLARRAQDVGEDVDEELDGGGGVRSTDPDPTLGLARGTTRLGRKDADKEGNHRVVEGDPLDGAVWDLGWERGEGIQVHNSLSHLERS